MIYIVILSMKKKPLFTNYKNGCLILNCIKNKCGFVKFCNNFCNKFLLILKNRGLYAALYVNHLYNLVIL